MFTVFYLHWQVRWYREVLGENARIRRQRGRQRGTRYCSTIGARHSHSRMEHIFWRRRATLAGAPD